MQCIRQVPVQNGRRREFMELVEINSQGARGERQFICNLDDLSQGCAAHQWRDIFRAGCSDQHHGRESATPWRGMPARIPSFRFEV